ncbi:hypothetical protein CONPUDRAFT_79395, partial [Coniophora puteana RWD-64-598 SS2]
MAECPWRAPFENAHCAIFQFSTLDNGAPRVRSHVLRDTLAPSSPPHSAHPILVSTTDVRTPKVTQLAQSNRVEAVFWAANTNEQYRIRGRAHVFPHRSLGGALHEKSSVFAQLKAEGFDWEAKRKEVFDALKPDMRASWARPTPGSPLLNLEDAEKWPRELPTLEDAQDEETRARVKEAYANYALLIIEPEQVDFCELGVVPNQRTIFTRTEEGWDAQRVVP